MVLSDDLFWGRGRDLGPSDLRVPGIARRSFRTSIASARSARAKGRSCSAGGTGTGQRSGDRHSSRPPRGCWRSSGGAGVTAGRGPDALLLARGRRATGSRPGFVAALTMTSPNTLHRRPVQRVRVVVESQRGTPPATAELVDRLPPGRAPRRTPGRCRSSRAPTGRDRERAVRFRTPCRRRGESPHSWPRAVRPR